MREYQIVPFMKTPVTVLPSYPVSPDGYFRFDQSRHADPESGREEILPWVYYREDLGEDVNSDDRYLLLPYVSGWPCWNKGDKEFNRFCFRAKLFPGVTFPVYADYLNECDGYEVLVVMNRACRVDREYRLFSLPSKVSWNESGDGLVIECSSPEDRKARRKYAIKEYEAAKPFIGGGPVDKDSPVHDRTRLENYLYFYDPAHCGPDPFKYAVRLRNRYLEEIKRPWEIIYDMDILED